MVFFFMHSALVIYCSFLFALFFMRWLLSRTSTEMIFHRLIHVLFTEILLSNKWIIILENKVSSANEHEARHSSVEGNKSNSCNEIWYLMEMCACRICKSRHEIWQTFNLYLLSRWQLTWYMLKDMQGFLRFQLMKATKVAVKFDQAWSVLRNFTSVACIAGKSFPDDRGGSQLELRQSCRLRAVLSRFDCKLQSKGRVAYDYGAEEWKLKLFQTIKWCLTEIWRWFCW